MSPRFRRSAQIITSRIAFLYLCLLFLGSLSSATATSWTLNGLVVDPTDTPIAGALITVLNAQGTNVQETVTDSGGSFVISGLVPASYALRVQAAHFATQHLPVVYETAGTQTLRIKMELAGINSEVTVTASRGNVETPITASQVVTLQDRNFLVQKPLTTVGNALDSSPGVMVQETTHGQSSPFMRGLTGYQTLLLIDGVRFNTSIFRSGPNQYLAYINPSQLERVEAILGPTSATYGSDSLGGTINLLTQEAAFEPVQGGSRIHGELNAIGASGDASGMYDARVSFGGKRLTWMFGGTARRLNNLRAGEGEDSRNSFFRYLGLPLADVRNLLGARLRNTGFGQYGADTKMNWRMSQDQSLTVQYLYSGIKGEHSYRDELGGPGKLLSQYFPQMVDFGYLRYEKQRLGFLDSLTGTVSMNSQSDGSIKQNLKYTDSITTDNSRVDSKGYSVQGASHVGPRHVLVFGGEVYDERVMSTRFSFDPVKGTTAQQRANYPNGTRYVTTGLFVQNASELIRHKVRLILGTRFTDVRMRTYADRNLDATGLTLGVTDTSPGFHDITFNSAVSWQFNQHAGVHVLVGRGFRAPNVSNLASLGVTTLGYEVPSYEAIAVGALMGADSGDGAVSTGKPVQKLGPESLYSYELGVHFESSKFYARVQAFDSELLNPISGRTLLFPVGSAPATIAGIAVTPMTQSAAQMAQGVVAVVTSLSPRSVKSTMNDGHSKYYGIDSLFRITLTPQWHFEGNYSILAGRDLYPNRPASKLPPQQGKLSVRYTPLGRFWLEIRNRFAGEQARLSGGDIDDDRIGASRSRTDIASFFRGGNASPYILTGADGKIGTSDDTFMPTGETLKQIQDRILPIGAVINGVTVTGDGTKVPLYLKTSGWYALDFMGGVSVGERTSLHFGLSNLGDRNYRIHGSGVDGTGFNLYAGFRYIF